MKIAFLLILLFNIAAAAQSGRVKPTPTPVTNRGLPGPNAATIREVKLPQKSKPTATPTATPLKDDEVIKVESALVPIPVSVLSRDGRSIRSLKREDFIQTVDGEPAEITDLFTSDRPVRLAMLFDNSSSVMIARDFEKDAAIRFFNRVVRPESDLAALFSVSTVTRLEQAFTKDVSSLMRSIEMFPPPSGATALLDGLIKAADYLKEVQGRRVIVIVSDGDDTVSDATFSQTVQALQMADCQVYIVKTTDFENYLRTGSRTGSANTRQLTAERRMAEIAEQTGGSVYSPIDRKELDGAFRQISEELSQQYILGYYPDIDRDVRGTFRTFALTLKRPENVTIKIRKGYYVK